MPISFALLFSFFSFASAPPLPQVKLHSATVSGISSGAFFSVQLQVALSGKIQGAASVAGGIYGCAEGQSGKALQCMLSPAKIDSRLFVAKAQEASNENLIDPVSNLSRARIHLFHSQADKVVKAEATAKLKEFFLAFTPAENIEEKYSPVAAHGFPTLNHGNQCEKQGLPWIQNCNEDLAGEILQHLYPGLTPPAQPAGQLLSFDQSLYSEKDSQLLPEGKIYLPSSCATGASCRLHIALHGCQMSTDFVQDEFTANAGYNRWADANHIVILYPQVDKSPKNPKGCWDWFGYTGADYALKSAKQIQAIQRMMEAMGI